MADLADAGIDVENVRLDHMAAEKVVAGQEEDLLQRGHLAGQFRAAGQERCRLPVPQHRYGRTPRPGRYAAADWSPAVAVPRRRSAACPALQQHASLRNVHDQFHATVGTRGMGQKCLEHSAGLAHVVAAVRGHHVEHEAGETSGVRSSECGNLLAEAGSARSGDRNETKVAISTTGATQHKFGLVGRVGAVGQTDRGEEGVVWFTR